jgi:hypothetical protein
MTQEKAQHTALSQPAAGDGRLMVRGKLLGRHTHERNGVRVHISVRGGTYLARGSYKGRRFGVKLGQGEDEAERALMALLVELDQGSFVPPSQAAKRTIKRGNAPKLDGRELVARFLSHQRQSRGSSTAQDYQGRLDHFIRFAERRHVRKRWPLAQDINHDFALEFRAFLQQLQLARNGHDNGRLQPVSPRQVQNILEAVRTMLNWARKTHVNELPSWFVNPIDHEIIGEHQARDPLKPAQVPVPLRQEMLTAMDPWELGILALPFVLPLRPEDFTGLLIRDIDLESRQVVFGPRFDGNDFNKGRQAFRVVLPEQLQPLVERLMEGRADGPLLRRRAVLEGKRRPELQVTTEQQMDAGVKAGLRSAGGALQAEQDRKDVVRKVIRQAGGLSEADLSKTFKTVLARVRPGLKIRFYETRGSVSTDMSQAGVDFLFREYVTGHKTSSQIMAHYEAQDLYGQFDKYYQHIEPLLEDIRERAARLLT